VKYYVDKDNQLRTTKCPFMSRIDISRICTLFIDQNWSKTAISRHSTIKYRNARIAKVVEKLKTLKTNDEYPDDMVDILFNFINKTHLEKEKCNQWIIEKMQQWMWKQKRKYTIR